MIRSFVKKCILFTGAALITGALAAENSFSSFAGAAADFNLQQNKSLSIEARGIFAGQYAIDNKFIIRGDFVMETDNILDGGLFQDTSARFTINEFSLSYRFLGNSVLQQFSGFVGKQESLGSDIFLKRYFGIRNFSTPFLTPQLHYSMSGIYDYEGVGVSYIIKLPASMAFGLYGTFDKDLITAATQTEKAVYQSRINFDVRYALAWDWGALDSGVGVILPVEKVDTAGTNVLLMLRKINLRTGIASLFEINGLTSIFMQFGTTGFQLAPKENAFKAELTDFYIFLEPRFKTNAFTYTTALFCLPESALENCMYTRNPIGFNIMMKSTDFLLLGHAAHAGTHFSVSAHTLTSDIKSYDVQLTPFLEYSLFNGQINAFSQFRPSMFKTPTEFVNISIGYKALL